MPTESNNQTQSDDGETTGEQKDVKIESLSESCGNVLSSNYDEINEVPRFSDNPVFGHLNLPEVTIYDAVFHSLSNVQTTESYTLPRELRTWPGGRIGYALSKNAEKVLELGFQEFVLPSWIFDSNHSDGDTDDDKVRKTGKKSGRSKQKAPMAPPIKKKKKN
ncbi:Transposase_23 domain-containing protein [Caenorhabditis elegans]|uniref:Transposase_23 domain-containing protein n=1 Tax=Caenorhabditis elegans TaxID=6239 RepID=A0A4V0IKQ5_CAEEL|nr:Transposase_23 domain-containing protein [Caenorhabditis elegans]VTW47622.1 Transposase_23 domain-containing protein [Caenorhabditis elegans]